MVRQGAPLSARKTHRLRDSGAGGADAAGDKVSCGVAGIDEITRGGIPRGRVTVVHGGAGCGKTILALQSLVAGARAGEPGLFVAFEEDPEHVLADTRRFDWDLASLRGRGVEFLDARLAESIVQGGEFDLLGLLAICGASARQVDAKRIVFDGIDVLLGHLGEPALIRREIFRLREWLYSTGMTGILTAKAEGGRSQPRSDYDFLQFIADCVVSLEHRVTSGAATRLVRVSKYRGDAHSGNEFPFAITSSGIEVAAGTAAELRHPISRERVTSGVERLDTMLGGGFYRGSSVLVTGAPGTSKTSLAAAFTEAACRRGEPTVYLSFDEAADQVVRNVASIGIDLAVHVSSGLLKMCALRAHTDNPQSHVARIRALVDRHHARNLVVDPLSALAQDVDQAVADRAALQVLDIAKSRGITTFSTSLLASSAPLSEETNLGVSTISDTWMHVSYVSKAGERNRALTVVKSRGTAHSNQVRELVLGDEGVTLADPYMADGEVLMGTLRWERENADRRAKILAVSESDLQQKQAELALAETRVRVEAVRIEQALREATLERIAATRRVAGEVLLLETAERKTRRGGDVTSPPAASAKRRPRTRP